MADLIYASDMRSMAKHRNATLEYLVESTNHNLLECAKKGMLSLGLPAIPDEEMRDQLCNMLVMYGYKVTRRRDWDIRVTWSEATPGIFEEK